MPLEAATDKRKREKRGQNCWVGIDVWFQQRELNDEDYLPLRSCKASYQVSDEYVGRKIKCPKCSAAILVAAEAKPAETKPAPAKQTPPPIRPAENRSASAPLVMAKKIASAPPAIRKPAVRSPSQGPAAASESADLPDIGVPASYRSTVAHHSKRMKQGDRSGLWIALGLGAGGLVLVSVFAAAFMFIGGQKPKVKPVAQNKPTKPVETEVLPIKSPPPGTPTLELQWKELEREGASVTVNGREVPLTKTGAIKYPLPPRDEAYHFHIEHARLQARRVRPQVGEGRRSVAL